jgi:hypothetical protein
MRRAEAVAGFLMSHGVDAMRISTSSAGKKSPVDTSVKNYKVNRRAELHYRASGDPPPDLVWAQQALAEKFPQPYRAVERFIPHDEPTLNDPQEDYHWGSLTSTMKSAVDSWISHYVGGFKPAVLARTELDDITLPMPDIDPARPVKAVVLHPRPAVEAILDEIITDQTAFVERMVGIPAASTSTAPTPPPVPCTPP